MPEIYSKYPMVKYLRKEALPTALCPGCGGGTVLNAFANAVDQLKLDPRDLVVVSGIGCSAWIASPYFLADTLHTTHGRAIAFATGVKVGLPDKKVVVISGDGDLASIGGNHLIHAARRNIDITVILVNNFIYGMTGGQVAPTTPFGAKRQQLHTETSSTPSRFLKPSRRPERATWRDGRLPTFTSSSRASKRPSPLRASPSSRSFPSVPSSSEGGTG